MSEIGHNSNVYIDPGRLSDEDKELLAGAVKELSDSFLRTEAERELQREILVKMNEQLGISKRVLRAVCKVYHKQNIAEVREYNSNFDELYEVIAGE